MPWSQIILLVLGIIFLPIVMIFTVNLCSAFSLNIVKSISMFNRFSIRVIIKVFRKIAFSFTLLLSSYLIVCLAFVLITHTDALAPENFLINTSFATVLAFILYIIINVPLKSKFNYFYFIIEKSVFFLTSIAWKKEASVTTISIKNSLTAEEKRHLLENHFFSDFFKVEPNELKFSVTILDSLVLIMTVISLLLLSDLNDNKYDPDTILNYTFLYVSIIIAKLHANHVSE